MFCQKVAALQCQKKTLKYKSEGVHFSKVTGLLPTTKTLLKMNSFIDIFQLLSNMYTNIYLAEQVSLAASESISYSSFWNLCCVAFPVSVIDTCFFLKVTVFLLKKFLIKERRKGNTGFLAL